MDLDVLFVGTAGSAPSARLGLPGMLKTFGLRQRERPLTVYGPAGLRSLFAALRPIVGRVGFPLELRELEPNEEIERDGYRIAAYETDHGVGALGYALVEDSRPGAFDPDRARELGVKPGPDFGRLQEGQIVDGVHPDQVMGDRRRGRRIVLAGDSAPCE